MKLLFAHDHKFRLINGEYYSPGGLSNEVLSRYTTCFGKTTVIARVISEENVNKKYSLIYNKNIEIKSYKKLSIRELEQEISNSDIVILRLPSYIGNILYKLAKRYDKPFLVEVVGCTWDSLWNHSFKGKLVAIPSYLAMKKAVKDAPYAIYVTNEFLQRRYPCNGKTINCSDVALQPLAKSILERRLNKIIQMNKNKPIVIGTIAAVNVRYKGQEYVIKAISKLNKEGYNFEYHLVGGGDNSYLKSIAKKYNVVDKVKFFGSLPHEKVFNYLDYIDIYIQPSKTEGLPRALVEALSRGCPSIGSNAGGIPELLNKDFIFHKGSVNEICELLKKMDQFAMIREAQRSFEKAKEYNKDLLNERRNAFYIKFAKGVKKSYD